MVEIREYVSKFEHRTDGNSPPEYRYVAYVYSAPAFMIEFFAANFHIYGPRALSIDEFLGNVRSAMQEDILTERMGPPPLRASHLFSAATMICASTDGETSIWSLDRIPEAFPLRGSLPNLESSFAAVKRMIPATASYLNITLPSQGVTHWADIAGTSNARSGFGFDVVPWEPLWYPRWAWWQDGLLAKLMAGLTTLPLNREDFFEIAAFTVEEWRKRYV